MRPRSDEASLWDVNVETQIGLLTGPIQVRTILGLHSKAWNKVYHYMVCLLFLVYILFLKITTSLYVLSRLAEACHHQASNLTTESQ